MQPSLFMTKKAENPCPLDLGRTYLSSPYKGVPPALPVNKPLVQCNINIRKDREGYPAVQNSTSDVRWISCISSFGIRVSSCFNCVPFSSRKYHTPQTYKFTEQANRKALMNSVNNQLLVGVFDHPQFFSFRSITPYVGPRSRDKTSIMVPERDWGWKLRWTRQILLIHHHTSFFWQHIHCCLGH